MADTTTRYGFPFQEAGDPPDGAGLGQDLAEAIEDSLGDVEDGADTRLDALEAPRHAVVTFNESVPNNAITVLTPNSELRDVGAMASGTTVTIPVGQDGWYEIGVILRYASQATAAGTRQARINLNGTEQITFQVPTSTLLNATNVIVSGVYEANLAAGDAVTFAAYQNSGVALSLVGNSRAWVRRLR